MAAQARTSFICFVGKLPAKSSPSTPIEASYSAKNKHENEVCDVVHYHQISFL